MRKIFGTASWGLLDQGLYSAAGFILAIAIGRHASLLEFGTYGILFAVVTLCVTIWRAFFVMPYMMSYGQKKEARVITLELRSGMLAAVSCSVAALSAMGVVVSILFFASQSLLLVSLAVTLPCVLFQDAVRYVVLNEYGARRLAVVDFVWVFIQVALLVLLELISQPTLVAQMFIWGFSCFVSVLACPGSVWRSWSVQNARRFLREHRRSGSHLAVESFATSGGNSVAFFLLGAVGQNAVVGGMRATQVLLGPLGVVSQGLLVSLTPGVLRIPANERCRIRNHALLISGLVGAFSAAYLILALFIPHWAGKALFGDSWSLGRELLIPLGLSQILTGVALGAVVGFRAFGVTRDTMLLRLILFPLTPTLTLGGLLMSGALGAALGLLLASVISVFAIWALFLVHSFRTDSAKEEVGLR
ncbi:hypothetical protein [Rhodococcus pyridinivorans]